MSTAPPAIILFSHGSRDPLWRAPIDAVARHITQTAPLRPVCCAFLELIEPSLPQAVAQCVAQGAGHITVVPMFLGTGKHAREDLPRIVADLRATHPHVRLDVQNPIGEDPRVTQLLAAIACEVAPR